MKAEIICTVCPLGCLLETEFELHKIISIKGNRCQRGIPYAEKEILRPERVVTTTVAVADGTVPLCPVKTSVSIPRDLCGEVMKETMRITVTAPIQSGDCLVKNICGTHADLVATRTISRKKS